DRFGRADRDLVKTDRGACGRERRGDVVVVARGDASRRQEDVVAALQGGTERPHEAFLGVTRDAEVRDLRARAAQRGDEERPVRVSDLRRTGRRLGRDDLVSGHEHGGPDRACHAQRRAPGRRGEDEVRRREAPAGGERSAPFGKTSPRRRTCAPGCGATLSRTVDASISTASSTGTTASLPGGIGAPVMTFHAAPVGSGPGTRPPPAAPARATSAGVLPTSAARTAQPSIAVASNGGREMSAAMSSARTRPAASPSATATAVSGVTARSTFARASSNASKGGS